MDDGLGEVVIVPEDAQGCSGEQYPASFLWIEPDPTHRNNAQDFAMGEEQHITGAYANAFDDTVRQRAYGIERLAARAAIAE